MRLPMLDIRSIGAGGGSIAWIDEGGALRVGPQSAGADPGPACYGRGGIGGDRERRQRRARLPRRPGRRGSLARPYGSGAGAPRDSRRPLGLDAVEAASGVYRVVNAHMADAMRLIASERGIDPSQLVLMAYGGAGPTHAAALARELDIRTTVIPPHPGGLSALGVATGDLAHDYATSVLRPLTELRPTDLAERLAPLEAEGLAALVREGIPSGAARDPSFVRRTVHRAAARPRRSARRPRRRVDRRDRRPLPRASSRCLRLCRRERVGLRDRPSRPGRRPDPEAAVRRGRRRRNRPSPDRDASGVVRGDRLRRDPGLPRARPGDPASQVSGPAVIDEYDSTTIVLPGQRWFVRRDRFDRDRGRRMTIDRDRGRGDPQRSRDDRARDANGDHADGVQPDRRDGRRSLGLHRRPGRPARRAGEGHPGAARRDAVLLRADARAVARRARPGGCRDRQRPVHRRVEPHQRRLSDHARVRRR